MKKTEEIFKKAINAIETGFTKNNFSEYENRILWFVFRKTYLWQKEMDTISLGQFEKGTRINRRHIGRTLMGLTDKKVLIKNTDSYITEYGINPNCSEWEQNQLSDIETSASGGTSACGGTGVVPREVLKVVPREVPTKKEVYNTKYTQQAEAIYSTYPRKADKNNSIKSIQKLLKSGLEEETLIRAVDNYKSQIENKGTEREFIIQSNNFFGRAERYTEFLEQSEKKTKPSQVERAMEACIKRGDI